MRLLITGISGFLGNHLARHALECGDTVAGTWLGGPPDPDVVAGCDTVEVDLGDRRHLAEVVERAAPEAVVHLGGLSHVGESWDRMGDYFRVNVLGTEHLLDAAAHRAPEARVVVASSSEVYGPVPEAEQPIAEDRPLDPRTPYALTKAAAERLALQRRGGAERRAVVVRSFNLLGPGQEPRFALPAFASQLAAVRRGDGEPVIRVGNLTPRRDFVHVADGARAYRVVAERGEPGGVYNLAGGVASSIGDALEQLLAVSGANARVEPDPERMRPVDLPLLCGDNTRLRKLGWEPRFGLEDAVRDLWRSVLDCRGG